MLWLLYFISALVPYLLLIPLNNYYFIFAICAFVVPLIAILVSNLIKDDTNYVKHPVRSLKLKRALYHPVFTLLISTSLFAFFATISNYLGNDYNVASNILNVFKEGISAITGKTNFMFGLFIFLGASIAVLFYFFKWLFSRSNLGLGGRGFWYVLIYTISLAMVLVPVIFMKVTFNDYFLIFDANKLLMYILLGCLVGIDLLITIALGCRYKRHCRLGKHRLARLHDKDDWDEYTRKELKYEAAFIREAKVADKKQAKLLKKVKKQNKKIHKQTAKLEKKNAKKAQKEEKGSVEEPVVNEEPQVEVEATPQVEEQPQEQPVVKDEPKKQPKKKMTKREKAEAKKAEKDAKAKAIADAKEEKQNRKLAKKQAKEDAEYQKFIEQKRKEELKQAQEEEKRLAQEAKAREKREKRIQKLEGKK